MCNPWVDMELTNSVIAGIGIGSATTVSESYCEEEEGIKSRIVCCERKIVFNGYDMLRDMNF